MAIGTDLCPAADDDLIEISERFGWRCCASERSEFAAFEGQDCGGRTPLPSPRHRWRQDAREDRQRQAGGRSPAGGGLPDAEELLANMYAPVPACLAAPLATLPGLIRPRRHGTPWRRASPTRKSKSAFPSGWL